MAFNLFPYSNFHKLNLDWVIKTIREAKEALDQAAQTVTGYESRLAAVESSTLSLSTSLQLLQGVVSGHTLRLDQAQNDIQNHTQQINNLDTTIQNHTQQINNLDTAIQNHTQQINNLGEDVQTALEKAEHPVITEENGASVVDPSLITDDYNRRILLLEGRSDLMPHVFSPVLRNIANPVLEGDAATKRYVDQLITNRFRKLIINVFPYSSVTNQNKVHYADAYDITPTSQAEGFNSMREALAALVGVGPEGAASVRPRTVNIEIHAYRGEPVKTPAFSNLGFVMPAIYDLAGFPSSQSGSESSLQISVRGGAALPGSARGNTDPNWTGDMYPTVCFTITSENTIEFYNWMEI